MSVGLTATMGFGVSPEWLTAGLDLARASTGGQTFDRSPELALRLGIGTVQCEALGAWLRLAGLTQGMVSRDGGVVTGLGRTISGHDPRLGDRGTWWVIHYQWSRRYVVWRLLAELGLGNSTLDRVDRELAAGVGTRAARTVRNARRSLISALSQTPIGTDLGLVRLVEEGRRVVALEKAQVRREAIPLPVFAYVVANWAKDWAGSSAPLERLAEPDAPGGIFHLSLGALERLLMEVEGAFGGTVLTYSRTAGLDEVYFHFQHSPLALLECYYRSRGAEKPCGEVLSEILTEGWEMEAE